MILRKELLNKPNCNVSGVISMCSIYEMNSKMIKNYPCIPEHKNGIQHPLSGSFGSVFYKLSTLFIYNTVS